MCGFVGVIGVLDRDVPLTEMLTDLRHRGPDDTGGWDDGNVRLRHCRLRVIDPSPEAAQPMRSSSGRYCCAYNGEIYNYKALRDRLRDRGHRFSTDSDTEVLLAAAEEWHLRCVKHFQGMFAFALYDRKDQSVHLVRDRLGIKPLYWTRLTHRQWVFASELRPLTRLRGSASRMRADAVAAYLSHGTVPSPSTIVEGIRLVEPGSTVRLKAGQPSRTETYWSLPKAVRKKDEPEPTSSEDAAGATRTALFSAVESRLVADVPLGAFLSGGIDSSLIVGIMSRLSARPVRTFTVAIDDADFDDQHYARRVADHFATDHTEVRLSRDEVLASVPRALSALDHPSPDGVNTFIVSGAVKRAGLTVALSGVGGDELFCGYDIFGRLRMQQALKPLWRLVPGSLRSRLGEETASLLGCPKGCKIEAALKTDGSVSSLLPVARQHFCDRAVNSLLNGHTDADHRIRYEPKLRQLLSEARDAPLLTKISLGELSTYLLDVLLRDTDQMSMAHALEVRVPFLDQEVVTRALRTPDRYKYTRGRSKPLLASAARDLLPSEVLNRPKQGFALPFATWMRQPLRPFCEEALTVLQDSSMFNADAVETYWREFAMEGRDSLWSRIWLLVTLASWSENNSMRLAA